MLVLARGRPVSLSDFERGLAWLDVGQTPEACKVLISKARAILKSVMASDRDPVANVRGVGYFILPPEQPR
jgi:DNA-binding response OmpR family regulator